MCYKKIILVVCFVLSIFSSFAFANATVDDKYLVAIPKKDDKFRYPFYVGASSGYGSTMWSGLVPQSGKINAALALSTPNNVTEGGAIWNVFLGYELIPQFAVEAGYTHYPVARINFSKRSLFALQHLGATEFSSHTESISMIAKIMLIIPTTNVRAFSSFGVAGVRRYDVLRSVWRASPTFGLGVNYNFTPHIMGEFGADYTAGYGESELSPASDYVPFLYSVFMRIAYRF
jgi:hypothetical protein